MKQAELVMRAQIIAGFTALLLVVLVAIIRADSVSAPAGWQGGRDEVRIEMSNNGFAPSEVQHAPGTFAIAVENKTVSVEYTLRLKADDGTVLSELQVQKGSTAWTVTLQTGRYTLSEASHPEWTCRIVIQ
jgi:hypothetical protein